MATSKKLSPVKRQRQTSTASTAASTAPRRSSRILKRGSKQTQPASPKNLIEAACLLQQDTDEGPTTKSVKRVSFKNDGSSVAPKAMILDFSRRRSSGRRLSAGPTIYSSTTANPFAPGHTQAEVSSEPLPPLNLSMPRSNSSVLYPIRAARLRRLIAAEILDEARRNPGITTMPKDTHHVDSEAKFTGGLVQTQPLDPMLFMLAELERHPRALTLHQISAMLKTLQDEVFGSPGTDVPGFSERYFNYTLTAAQQSAWPLHELRTKYIPLYMTARYIADGSQHGWRDFFTQPESRQSLVSAILGEWFTQRIFKHTAFGFPRRLTDFLEEKDREFLNYDAIVRSKERAKLMRAWLNDFRFWPDIQESTTAAADDLAEELLAVLQPLLPPPIFDPLETSPSLAPSQIRKDSIALRKGQQGEELRRKIKADLFHLIMNCAALHKGIRLTGEDGIIVRMAPGPEKGSRFHLTAPFDCVNQLQVNQTQPLDHSEPSQLCIKMTCWPRVEAIAPEGPDMAELEHKEKADREDHFMRNRSHENDDDDEESFSWEGRDEIWPIVPDSLQDNEGRNPGKIDPETGEVNTIKRAAYVTIYPTLCHGKVYCEWTPQPVTRGQTLPDAVAEARQNHARAVQLRLEDLRIDLWNCWALYGGVAEWAILATASVVALCKYFHIPWHVRALLMKLVPSAKSILRTSMSSSSGQATEAMTMPSSNPVISHTLVEQISSALNGPWTSSSPFGQAITRPIQTIFLKPLAAMFGLAARSGHDEGFSSTSTMSDLEAGLLSRALHAVQSEATGNEGMFEAIAATLYASAWSSMPDPMVDGAGMTSMLAAVASETPVANPAAMSFEDVVMEDDVISSTTQRLTTGWDAGEGEVETGIWLDEDASATAGDKLTGVDADIDGAATQLQREMEDFVATF